MSGAVALLGCGGVGRTFACEAALPAAASSTRCGRRREMAASLRSFVQELVPGAEYTITSLDRLEGTSIY